MRRLLILTLLLCPLLAGLAFPAVGDTVIYDNVRYIITADSDTAREVSIDYIFEQPYVSIPASIIRDDTEYKITAHTYNPVFPSSDDYSNPAHITKVDFCNAIYITDIPVTSYLTKAIDIDTLILPPNLQKIDNCMASYDPDRPADYFLYERPVGIKRLFASGRNPRYATLAGCAHLLEADISCTSLDSLYYNATGTFYGCLWIEKIRVPNGLTHFWGSTFDCCLNLTDINMPDSLIYIGPYVFNACYALDSIVIPAKTNHIDPLFALETHSLEKIVVDPDNPYFKSDDGVLYTVSGRTMYTIPFSLPKDTLIFPENVDTVNELAFASHYNNLGQLPYFHDSTDYIRHFVFNDGLRILGEYAFHCSPLETAENFGHTSVSHIPKSCFSGSLLRGIELPIELSSIAPWAFDHCLRLDSVRFLGSVVSSIGEAAFSRCTSLDSLDLSAQTRLRTISASLCWGDSALRSVKLPTSIDSIGSNAFYRCVSLSEIEVPVLDPIPVDTSVFSGVDKSSCRLIVPAPSIGKYRAAPVWRDFLRIESGDLLTITVLSADSLMGGVTGTGVYRYGDSPYIAANPSRGYRFTRWSDGSTEQYRRVALTSDSTLTAYFELNPEFQYRVSVRTADPAMGSVSPTTAYARHGETVTITATPLSGYRFALWSDSVTANPRDVTVTRDTVLTAHFAPYTPDTFTVTLLCDSAMGEVSGSGRYPEGTAATLEATPKTGYAFTRWEDNRGFTFTDNPLTLTVTCDTTLTALFREDGTGHSPAADDNCAAWVTPDGTLRVRCPGCRLMELRTVTGLTLYSGVPADIPLPHPGVYLLTLDGDTYKVMRR